MPTSRRRRHRRAAIEPLEGRVLMCLDGLDPAHHPGAAVSSFGGAEVRVESNGWDSHVIPADSALANASGPGALAWTTGNKTVLYIRVTFSDQATSEPQSYQGAVDMMAGVSDFIEANSFGLTSMTATVTDLIVLPEPVSFYNTNGDFRLRADALAAARAANPAWYNVDYDLDAVRWNGGPGSYGGQAYVGARGCWLKSSSVGVAAHEFGHNFGLWHANYWVPTDPQTVIGPGSNTEYGDVFDTMGSASAGQRHFNDYEKDLLDWIPDANITAITDPATGAGRYRIYAHDLFDHGGAFDASRQYGIKIRKDADRDYRLDFRQHPQWISTNRWIANGVGVRWDRWAGSNRGSQWLDTTPQSPDGRNDGAVVIGRTFTDDVADIHITPVRKGSDGTGASWVEVQVNFGDPAVTGDRGPTVQLSASATTVGSGQQVTFTAAASDPDGDELAYSWDFGDRTIGTNSPTATHTWGGPAERRVRVTVSDMKGRTASASLLITIGNPIPARITGRVVDAAGNPVADVRVHNGRAYNDSNYRYAYTDADGTYVLTDLAVGASYTVGAARAGYTLAAGGFTNPVQTGAGGVDFVATETRYRISGKVTADGSTPLAGATVTLGDGASAVTNAQGDYSLTAGIGSHTLSVSRSGYQFAAQSPVLIEYADVTRNISARTSTINGRITGVPVGTVVTVTDGVRSRTVTISQGQTGGGGNETGFYSLTVPFGVWNVTASSDAYSFAPVGWTNPVTVNSGTGQSSFNFLAQPVRTYAVRGRVTDAAGEPLAGVRVASTSFESTTDSGGGYALSGLPAGDHTVVPTLAGRAFSPGSRTVRLASATGDLSGEDFAETLAPATVAGRHVFYNNSAFDGNNPASNAADDAAVATDKAALLPGGTATFANYTSYAKGLNGILIDIAGLPPLVQQLSRSNDFIFRVGNGGDPAGWDPAPTAQPIPAIRRGGGVAGSDRVTVTWTDGLIKGKWLQVTVKATPNTGLAVPDVFYFGNAPGESGNWPTAALVNSVDEAAARHRPRGASNPAPVTFNWDYNRDGLVNRTDQLIARANRTTADTDLNLITAPAGGAIRARASAPPMARPADLFSALRVTPDTGRDETES